METAGKGQGDTDLMQFRNTDDSPIWAVGADGGMRATSVQLSAADQSAACTAAIRGRDEYVEINGVGKKRVCSAVGNGNYQWVYFVPDQSSVSKRAKRGQQLTEV